MIHLKPPCAEFFRALAVWMQDPKHITVDIPWMPSTSAHLAIKWQSLNPEEHPVWAVWDDERPIGWCHFGQWNRYHRTAWFYAKFAPDVMGTWKVARAVFAAMDWAFKTMDLHRITYTMTEEPHVRVWPPGATPWTLEGTMRELVRGPDGERYDAYLYGVTKDEFYAHPRTVRLLGLPKNGPDATFDEEFGYEFQNEVT